LGVVDIAFFGTRIKQCMSLRLFGHEPTRRQDPIYRADLQG
jgi:hypothetical protein